MSNLVGQFSGYLNESFPSQINLDVTMFCNLRCIHCPYESVTHPMGKSRVNMPVELHSKIIDEISSSGKGITRYLRYTGDGEPLIHPELSSMISYARKTVDLPINLTTNGSFLSEQKFEDLAKSGVNVFDVSIDAATEDTYSKIRVGGDFTEVTRNTLNAVKRSKFMDGVSVVVSFVKQDLNHHEVNQFTEFWKDAGVKDVVIRNGHSAAGAIKSRALELWESAPKPRTACLYPWERLVVKADGEITYCPADWHHIAGVGNLKTSSIAEVWTSDALKKLREDHVQNTLAENSFCGKCPDWSVIKWPNEGRSYATLMHELASEI
jgi:radical SAM protein with 4Fe4S-binding SPASM domain